MTFETLYVNLHPQTKPYAIIGLTYKAMINNISFMSLNSFKKPSSPKYKKKDNMQNIDYFKSGIKLLLVAGLFSSTVSHRARCLGIVKYLRCINVYKF